MSSIPLSDAQRLDACPFTSDGTLTRLDVSVVDASVSLGSGGWVAVLEDSSLGTACIVRFAAAASEPASGASLASAFLVPAGAAATLYIEATTTVHAIMRSGTGRLFFQRVI